MTESNKYKSYEEDGFRYIEVIVEGDASNLKMSRNQVSNQVSKTCCSRNILEIESWLLGWSDLITYN